MSAQYSLPMEIQGRRADRNLEGVRACILDAIWNAQGKGCGPGFIGVAIGGDRASGYEFAKRQLLRNVDDSSPDPALAELEARIMKEANTLDIGPMGFSGKFTAGCCKIGKLNRLPASFFVSVAYMCWAYRRRGVVLDVNGNVREWLYQAPHEFQHEEPMPELTLPAADVVRLQTPLSEADIRKLKAGDVVLLDGVVFTGRDAVHKYLHDGGELDVIRGGVIYHCGPVVLKDSDGYRVVAGGAAQIYAQCVQRVLSVRLEQFGSPEAVWELEVKNFPAVVAIDSHGNNLQQVVTDRSRELLTATL